MTSAAAIIRSTNAGEVSLLIEGRTDWDRYPASMKTMENFVASVQGPAIRRSGTIMEAAVQDHARVSALVPFVFNNEQASCVEFGHNVIRFVDEGGLLTETPVGITSVISTSPFVIEAAGLGATVGSQVALAGFPSELNVNGEFATVTAVASDEYTLDMTYANPDALATGDATAALVVSVTSTYSEVDAPDIKFIQDQDTLFLFCDGHRPRKLNRLGAVQWELVENVIEDGPYLDEDRTGTTLTPASTGNAATNALGTASGSAAASHAANLAFDEDNDTYWESNVNQTGRLEFDPTTDFACTGYAIYVATENSNTSFTSKDYAPGKWTFEGYDGTNWITLDSQTDYVLYDGHRSVYFKLNNTTTYQKYAIDIKECTRNGALPPRIASLVLTSVASVSVDIEANQTDGINDDQGFVSTDVGRLIRLRGSDSLWHAYRITVVTDSTNVTGVMSGAPLPGIDPVLEWRLGAWSDTTGWPTCAGFFEDRMLFGGSDGAPNLLAGSVTGEFSNLSPTDDAGEVLDDNGFAVFLRGRQLARIRWIEVDEKAILIGTGSGEWVVTTPDSTNALGPRNISARQASRRGMANVDAVKIDRQVLAVQKAGRALRELAFVFEVDGYKMPSMSVFASHIGSDKFAQLQYAAEPHSIVWVRQASGQVAGFTYNRDENVIGWHRHDFGGVVESIAVIPANDERQDILWLTVRRTVNGSTVRFIERLAPFWDFDSTIANAHFVDCGLSGTFSTPTQRVFGAQHLEGEMVYGLADGVPFGLVEVVDGSFDLPEPASTVVFGLPYTSLAETSRMDIGSQNGTSMGKTKRVHTVTIHLWDSAEGEVGRWNQDSREMVFEPIDYSEDPYDEIEVNDLETGVIGPITLDRGYGERATIAFRQTSPLPFNVISLMPELMTMD